MAEGLGTGLQNRLRGFKSLCHLQFRLILDSRLNQSHLIPAPPVDKSFEVADEIVPVVELYFSHRLL